MKPVFSRLEDYKRKSRKEILCFAILFFVATRIVSMVVIAFTTRLYFLYGFDAMSSLQFGGSFGGLTEMVAEKGLWRTLLKILIVAPLWEEAAFRLGLSFKRRDMALGLGALALFLVSRICAGWWIAVIAVVAVAATVWLATTDEFWNGRRAKWLTPAAWASAVLFGLAHMFNMHGLTLVLLPYALSLCLMLFFAGATFVYLRVNLGFGWGLAAHVINNVPPLIMLALTNI